MGAAGSLARSLERKLINASEPLSELASRSAILGDFHSSISIFHMLRSQQTRRFGRVRTFNETMRGERDGPQAALAAVTQPQPSLRRSISVHVCESTRTRATFAADEKSCKLARARWTRVIRVTRGRCHLANAANENKRR